MEEYCDVLIIGGGPAGLSAANKSAEIGQKTICIERKKSIGDSIKCAEGIGTYCLTKSNLKIPKKILSWKIDGIDFWLDGKKIERRGEIWEGYTINRSEFEKWLARSAEKKDAKIITNSRLLNFSKENKSIVANILKDNQKMKIIAKTMIAADGCESIVLNQLGKLQKAQEIATVKSYEMSNVSLNNPKVEQVFIGNFAPAGYGYVFPKNNNTANIGVGSALEKNLNEKIKEFFLVPEIAQQIKGSKKVVEKSKRAVWGEISKDWILNKNIFLAGDAANQTIPPFIEGIIPATIGGDIAAELAMEYNDKKEPDNEKYKAEYQKRLGDIYEYAQVILPAIREIFSMKPTKRNLLFFGLSAQIFEEGDYPQLFDKSEKELEKMIATQLKT